MFGAISRKITRALETPLIRARSTNSAGLSENVWARIARAAHGHEVRPMKTASSEQPAGLQVGGHDDEQGERRDHQHDVGEHVQDLVDAAAPVAGHEADGHPDQRRDAAAERAPR